MLKCMILSLLILINDNGRFRQRRHLLNIANMRNYDVLQRLLLILPRQIRKESRSLATLQQVSRFKMALDVPVHDAHANVPVNVLRSIPSLVVPDDRAIDPRRDINRDTVDFFLDLEHNVNIVLFRTPMPVNILHAPLGKQAVDFALRV